MRSKVTSRKIYESIEQTDYDRKNVVLFRNKFGFERDDLGQIIGVSECAVRHWESGVREIPEPIKRLLILFDKKPQLMKEF